MSKKSKTSPKIALRYALAIYEIGEKNNNQKDEIIPEIVKGKILFSLALSEPEAGSDASAITTSATKLSENSWSLKGHKIWVDTTCIVGHEKMMVL